MKLLKNILTVLLCTAVLLLVVFLIGRYGWKLGGFRACESAGIEQVHLEENQVRICGFYHGSFPQGFQGRNRFANMGSSSVADSFVTTLKLEGETLVDMTFTTDPAEYVQRELVSVIKSNW